ncbi:MAG: STN domain-containing protein [Thermodesulfobacteriota bacterium]|nr:STN domain-containing protein [Thermodesulfobacteriota bacterium]
MIANDKNWIVFLFALALLGASFYSLCWAQGDLNVTWEKETLYSAEITGVPLQRVLEHLSDEEGMWFEAHKSVAAHKVSVHFEGLSLEEGLRRIFAGLDYSLEFDGEGNPSGIVIIGEEKSPRARGRVKAPTARRRVPVRSRNTTEPMELDEDDEDDEDDEERSSTVGPYGPDQVRVQKRRGVMKPPQPDESADEESPYGPGDVNPEGAKSAQESETP